MRTEMTTTSQSALAQFRHDIGEITASSDERQLRQKSRDFYWYSPVLTEHLQDCRADIVVEPRSKEESHVSSQPPCATACR
jgi:hypothetical protein